MPNVRRKHKNKKWQISESAWEYARYYAFMYNEWRAMHDALDSRRYMKADVMPRSNSLSSPVESDGIRREELSRKMEIIDQTLIEADPEIYQWLKVAVTNRGVTYKMLSAQGMPCGADMYYDRRRKFYYLLSQKI